MYSVYKITNILNSKYYIGVHKSKNPNDAYMGSGRAIKRAIEKYGRQYFTKTIILVTESKEEAYNLEIELTENFNQANTYNMRRGGVGGFTRENALKGALVGSKVWSVKRVESAMKNLANLTKEDLVNNGRKGGLANKGKPKSEEHKEKVREVWRKKRECRTTVVPSAHN